MTLRRGSPAALEEEAREAQERGDWKAAAKLWRVAAKKCLGRERADRYRDAAKSCDHKAWMGRN